MTILLNSDIASTWDRADRKKSYFGGLKATVVFSSQNNSKTEPEVAWNKTS